MNIIRKFISLLIIRFKYRNCNIKSLNIAKDVVLGDNCLISKCTQIADNVTIGDCTYFNSDRKWIIIESNVKIGKFCSIAPGVVIGVGNHNYNNITTHPILYNNYYLKKMKLNCEKLKQNGLIDRDVVTEIGNDVWIGMDANIKRGVKIGDGAVIGAGTVVTHDVPPYAIVAGVPGRVIKYRFTEEQIKFLLENKWWDWSKEELNQKFELLYSIDDFMDRGAKNEVE